MAPYERTTTFGSRDASQSTPDPLVLSLLRVFSGLHVLTMGTTGLSYIGHEAPHHAPLAAAALVVLFGAIFLCTYVDRFVASRRYLTIVLGALCAAPLLGEATAMVHGVLAYQKMATELVLVLVVPVVFVAWKRSFSVVVGLVIVTGGLDIGLAHVAPMDPGLRDVFLHLLISRTGGLLILGYLVSRLAGRQRREHELLAEAHARLESYAVNLERLATSRERNRVARELHDTLAHTLSAITVQLEAVHSLVSPPGERLASMLERTTVLARSGLGEVRRALRELRASPLEDLGLVLAVRGLVEGLSERTGVELVLVLPEGPLHLSEAVEQGLFRIAQEAIENIEHHSGANRVRFELTVRDDNLSLTVCDNGRGFEPNAVDEDHYGLRGIKERAELLGGTFSLTTAPSQGTLLKFTLPLASRNRPESP